MGAYDNPQQIKTRADLAAKGVQSFYQSLNATADGIMKHAQARKARAEKARKKRDTFEAKTYGEFDKQAAAVEQQIADATKTGIAFQEDALRDNLILIRSKMDEAIAEAGGQDAPLSTLNQIKNKALNQVSVLKKDLENLAGGYRVYKELKDIPAGQQDAILSTFHPEMIDIFEDLDAKKGNIGIFLNDKGDGFTLSQFEDNTGKTVVDAVDLTKYRLDVEDNDKQFFDTTVTDSLKDRSNHLQVAINNFGDKYGFNTTVKKPVMTRNANGDLVQATKLVGGKAQLVFTNEPIIDQQKFDEFLESADGNKWIKDYYVETGDDGKSTFIYEPESLYSSFTDVQKTGGKDIGAGFYSPENFESTLKNIFRNQVSQ